LTPSPTAFEQAYHAYSSSIHRALSNPAPVDFYFKKGSLTERRFSVAEWERDTAAFGGKLAGKKDEGEVQGEEGVVLNYRNEGEGDGEGRDKVERKGERNVYLVVKRRVDGKWTVPRGNVGDGEALHEAAIRHLHQNFGIDMDTWLVTRQPVTVIRSREEATQGTGEKVGDMTFVFKSHILAGRPVPSSTGAYDEVAWLTKEEIEGVVGPEEWEGLQSVLS